LHENTANLSKPELFELVSRLKQEKNILILVHNYQTLDVQKIGDFVGDSLELARKAAQSDCDMILLCGIRIMAETAKILSPHKRVFLSHPEAICPLAEMKSVEDLKVLKSGHPDAEIVCYVNSTAQLKAESTITCTSANTADIISALPSDKEIIFIPDKNLGSWAAYKSGRELIMWDGYCYVHDQISLLEAIQVRDRYSDHKLIVHPECNMDVCKLADKVCSTSQMIQYVKENDKVIVGTETGLLKQLIEAYPEKDLVPLSTKMICKNMQKTTLEQAVNTLLNEENEIFLPEEIIVKAQRSLTRMFEILI